MWRENKTHVGGEKHAQTIKSQNLKGNGHFEDLIARWQYKSNHRGLWCEDVYCIKLAEDMIQWQDLVKESTNLPQSHPFSAAQTPRSLTRL
jgi:hypothetical protein